MLPGIVTTHVVPVVPQRMPALKMVPPMGRETVS